MCHVMSIVSSCHCHFTQSHTPTVGPTTLLFGLVSVTYVGAETKSTRYCRGVNSPSATINCNYNSHFTVLYYIRNIYVVFFPITSLLSSDDNEVDDTVIDSEPPIKTARKKLKVEINSRISEEVSVYSGVVGEKPVPILISNICGAVAVRLL